MIEHHDLLRSFKDNCGFGLVANIKNRSSHKVLNDAVTALERMMHRGAIAADGKTGDGSGLLLSMPTEFLKNEAQKKGVELPNQFAVAAVFTKNKKNLVLLEFFLGRPLFQNYWMNFSQKLIRIIKAFYLTRVKISAR